MATALLRSAIHRSALHPRSLRTRLGPKTSRGEDSISGSQELKEASGRVRGQEAKVVEERVAVGRGDVTAFPAGTGLAYAFVADPEEELEILSIGERKENEVIVYPDTGKLLVAGIVDGEGRRYNTVGRLCEADY
jgi:hypothetical protein